MSRGEGEKESCCGHREMEMLHSHSPAIRTSALGEPSDCRVYNKLVSRICRSSRIKSSIEQYLHREQYVILGFGGVVRVY